MDKKEQILNRQHTAEFEVEAVRLADSISGHVDPREIQYVNLRDAELPTSRLNVGDVRLCEENSPNSAGHDAISRGEFADCLQQDHFLRVRLDTGEPIPELVLAAPNGNQSQSYVRTKARRATKLVSMDIKGDAALSSPGLHVSRQQHSLAAFDNQVGAAQAKQAEAATVRHSAWTALESALSAAPEGATW